MFLKTLLVSAVVSAVLASSALADSGWASGSDPFCGGSQVFAAYGDTHDYIAMQPLSLTAFLGNRGGGVTIPSGGSITYAGTCVQFLQPLVRLFAQDSNPSGTLTVTIHYMDDNGFESQSYQFAGGETSMTATPPYTFSPDNLRGDVFVTLSASGGSSWTLGGVYIDPFISF